MLPTLALALLSHLSSSTCALQGELAELERSARRVTLEVGDGAAVVTVRDTVARAPSQAGHYETVFPRLDGTMVGVLVRADGALIEGRLDDDDDAADRFGTFETALKVGVPAIEANGGKVRTAVLASLSSGCCGIDGDEVAVQVATTCGTDALVVETTWVLESEPYDGAWRFRLPRDSQQDLPLTVKGASVRKAFVDGALAKVVVHGEGEAVIDVLTQGHDTLRGRASLERVDPMDRLGPPPHDEWGKVDGVAVVEPSAPVDVVRVEVDVPRPLADPAAGLRVVFVLDASTSAGTMGIGKARTAMEGVLDALPDDARYSVVAFARRPWLVVDPWSSPRERFVPDIAPQNGSDLVGALTFAHGLAHDVAPEETPRIIVVSDLMQANAVTDAVWGARLASLGVLTHVVALPADVDDAEPYSWVRVIPDEDPRAEAVEGTGGIFVEIGAGDESDALLWPHLVVPTRIDQVELELAGRDPLEDALASHGEVPEVLLSGTGVRVQSALPVGAHGPAFLTGFLWSQPLALALDAAPATRRLSLARAAFGPVAAELPDDVVRAAAKQVNAVSRVTSLVQVPDYRPREPEGMGFGMSGCGCCGCCGCCGLSGRGTRSVCGIGAAVPIVGELDALQARLSDELQACKESAAALRIEMEDKEILDVVSVRASTCVVERVWRWDLQRLSEEAGLADDRVFERHFVLTVEATVPVDEAASDPEGDDADLSG
ncbi:MAG: VWA domain-containing protein [Deltaproteobacteria bacterium]|nr:VWA domain-containing protein [Deltaproteobacteria bacterium]